MKTAQPRPSGLSPIEQTAGLWDIESGEGRARCFHHGCCVFVHAWSAEEWRSRSAWLIRNALLVLLIALVAAATPLCLTASTKALGQFMTTIDRFDEERPVLLKRFDELINTHSGDRDFNAIADRLEQEVLQPGRIWPAGFRRARACPNRSRQGP